VKALWKKAGKLGLRKKERKRKTATLKINLNIFKN